ncbi:MAG: alanine--tRNA ligase, partial [Pseudomonadota bacterium]
PGNEGRGYVLRRIIRRAIRHGYKLGQKQPFFHRLVADLDKAMGDAYPELRSAAKRVADVLKQEEERFAETLEHGMGVLEGALASGEKLLDGETIFKLYDTFGFPVDLTADICRERGVSLDLAGFEAAMGQQRERARAASRFTSRAGLDYSGRKTDFRGYDALSLPAKVIALYCEGSPAEQLKAGAAGVVVLDQTPFYAESGGQVGDQGELVGSAGTFSVADTQKIQPDVFGHHGTLRTGALKLGDKVEARVDTALRGRTMRNHSVTHLMHKALREVLGPHVQQKGSLVDSEKTRFDFAHDKPMSDQELRDVELRVNNEIMQNIPTRAQVMPIEEAKKSGAMMLFGEKYGDEVRVLDIGSSREFCGGTHVERTGDIGVFKIYSEGGVAAGIRRVEAATGGNALALMNGELQEFYEVAKHLRVLPRGGMVDKAVSNLLEEKKTLEKELARLRSKIAMGQGEDLAGQAVDVKGIKVLAASLDGADVKTLRETMDKLKDKLKSAAIVLGAVSEGKVSLIAGVTADLTGRVKAGELVNFVAQQVGGKGGGRPDMAQAGGTEPSKLASALQSVKDWVEQRI